MSTNKKDILCWMEKAELDKLNANIKSNLDRYKSGNFDDLAAQPSWTKTHLLSYDASKFKGLSGKSANEDAEMLIIYSELKELKPRLARCLNTWVGLTHTHLLKYGRERWLEPYFSDEEELINKIRKHFFAGGRPGVRDDNTAGRCCVLQRRQDVCRTQGETAMAPSSSYFPAIFHLQHAKAISESA